MGSASQAQEFESWLGKAKRLSSKGSPVREVGALMPTPPRVQWGQVQSVAVGGTVRC